MVKIGIDGQFCGVSTGIGQYTSYLVEGLGKCVSTETKLTLVLARNRTHLAYPSTVRVASVPPAHRLIWANLYAPWVVHRERFDLYHAVDNLSLPLFWPKGQTPYVLTIHDLLPLLFPQGVRPRQRYEPAIVFSYEGKVVPDLCSPVFPSIKWIEQTLPRVSFGQVTLLHHVGDAHRGRVTVRAEYSRGSAISPVRRGANMILSGQQSLDSDKVFFENACDQAGLFPGVTLALQGEHSVAGKRIFGEWQ